MGRTRRSLRASQPNSPEATDDEDLRSPVSDHGDPISPTVSRGRKGKAEDDDGDSLKVSDAMDVVH